ncbi:4'-phosphopantetheinyl transferase family protein [Desulfovibrio intestinalis]|uniref:4'-phosphopantetheinyl transferase n=1 Tax=Desulfovibrio intestinalis TaxID=58621 RepID=A0A7W8FH74_9BACT|nr:4'-phosphopantetheinyl transferase superfamily protein [Desulfovibrio intestinalis]MBB5144666.1 4'-phosphopantetheinyl transferase [Desulfovibrio intestinalis]
MGLRIDQEIQWSKACRPYVTKNELDKSARFRHSADAVRHIAGRALVRRMLEAAGHKKFDDDFFLNPYGKPYSPGSGLHFSISHSGSMVWAAFCREAPVGIDVESQLTLPDLADLATQLHPREAQAIDSFSPEERTAAFYRCWTRKEAVLKALGKGLSLPLNSFQVRVDSSDTNWLVLPPDEDCRAEAGKNQHAPEHGCGQEEDFSKQGAAPATWTSQDVWCAGGYQCSVAALASGLEVDLCVITDP